jgi:hypothetical protein
MPTRDTDIRAALRAGELARHRNDGDTIIVEEMGIYQGDFRIDIAVVNGKMTGYEIKSDRDTLSRLAAQAKAYSAIFDEIHLVVGIRHLDAATAIIPEWWGVQCAVPAAAQLPALKQVRAPMLNEGVDAAALARLLWAREAIPMLDRRGGMRGLRGKSREFLWAALAERYSLAELRAEIRTALKARDGWGSRSDEPQLRQQELEMV